MKIILRVLCILWLVVLTNQVSIAKDKLVFAVDLVRHGDRAPCQNILGHSWDDSELGQLTELGASQSKLLGTKFKEYYIQQTHLLPEGFQPNLIHVQSSYVKRTKDTAKALLSGFYPNENTINVVSLPKDDDHLFMNQRRKQFNNEKKAIFKLSDEMLKTSQKRVYKRARKALEKINATFGANFSLGHELVDLADLLYVSRLHNKTGFEKLSKSEIDEIIDAGHQLILELNRNPRLYCIRAQNFVLNLANLFENASSSSSQSSPTYVLYVGHDGNIISTTSLLGFPVKVLPPYLADLRFEMFESAKRVETFVKVSFNGQILKICGADTCPTAKFIETLRSKVNNTCGEASTSSGLTFS